ncbi:MAG: methylmalonyl-CoA mutase family protein [Bdellovibrionales bacterium]|nr:methylmalonyl-CoA mutase family protein [Bdellovibrionales bacterium]
MPTPAFTPRNKIRVVTAASLFDGHDAAINIMRRVLQSLGAEVIHLGHNRSAREVVDCAVQEDAQAIALTSYQGGHVEYFKYMVDLLKERGCAHIKIFGGGGGVILPTEIAELQAYGVARIYSPDDGRAMGLQGMIADLLSKCDFPVGEDADSKVYQDGIAKREPRSLARLISGAENFGEKARAWLPSVRERAKAAKAQHLAPILGITGTGGAGKSSLVDELVRRFLADFPSKTVAILAVDPSRRKTGGALLGDRIRMNAISHERVYMRSMATRQSDRALSGSVDDALAILRAAGFDLVILESSGIGQSDTEITRHADVALYVMTPEYGAATQLEKIDMLDFADLIALNKFDKRGAQDALRDVRRQVKRNRQAFEAPDETMPVFATIASQFNDPGMTRLYRAAMDAVAEKTGAALRSSLKAPEGDSEKVHILPPSRTRYLAEIADTVREYEAWTIEQSRLAQDAFALDRAGTALKAAGGTRNALSELETKAEEAWEAIAPECRELLETWPDKVKQYTGPVYRYDVRGKTLEVQTHTQSLSGIPIPKISLPRTEAWGDLLKWQLQENVPGEFPYAAGVFPFKRENEDPTRMFAGEGGPERTNRRFHYVSKAMPAKRLSTAFDSVTLYGEDPAHRPDIYGKVGNSGVSVCCLDDAKKLYSGFDLADPRVSVSMTINGPAPVVTGFFLNAAVDQQCEKWLHAQGRAAEAKKKVEALYPKGGRPAYQGPLPEGNDGLGLLLLGAAGDQVLEKETYERIKAETLTQVRGTVQADILKEDQAQNTCIFSTEFSLRLMGDLQQYFITQGVRNFYSVSISGYHIAEAGANPISQLAFTLANGFTYVEYYLSRGMKIDDFAPNLSFFFSNGVDPEYSVIGRVARRIWAKAMKKRYGAGPRSQMLKYHIQTSGRSLHAQEIDFNDIRTTLQAVYAIFDNCNSLHTNAYDEAITTPTEESVRRAIAIQLIINQEMGLSKNQNPFQGAFIIEELTELVEKAVLMEFDRITERGGVLGAMETMYQRSKIQEESLHYETLKHTGGYPIVGVNTFLSSKGSPTILPREVIRSTTEEKEYQVSMVAGLRGAQAARAKEGLARLQQVAVTNRNAFESLMDVTRYCSLGQITGALYQVGGQYRRNM